MPRILLDSGITTATVLFIISTANVFAWVIAANMIPLRLANIFLSVTDNPLLFLLLVNVFLLVVGMFMESGAAIILLRQLWHNGTVARGHIQKCREIYRG